MNLLEYTNKQLKDAYQYQFDLKKDMRPQVAILRTTVEAKKKLLRDEMDRRGMSWRILNSQKEINFITPSLN